jgi:hypothetical protein
MPSKKRFKTKKLRQKNIANIRRALKNKNKSVKASKYRALYGISGGGIIRTNGAYF